MLTGVAIGLMFARYLASLLYGVTPYDGPTIVVVAVTFVGVSFVAGFVPSYRAMRIDPIRALRYE
jgi:ABC-type antimicrobial peptide transport system permease subunit